MSKITIPTHAKIKKGTNWDEDGYGQVWCPVEEIRNQDKEMSLIHPKLGAFAWVDMEDCEFKTVKNFEIILCDNCGEMLVEKEGDICEDCKREEDEEEK